MIRTRMYYWCTAMLLGVAPAWGQFDSGSDGSDGAFSLQADTVIEESKPDPITGKGSSAPVEVGGKRFINPKFTLNSMSMNDDGSRLFFMAGDATIAGSGYPIFYCDVDGRTCDVVVRDIKHPGHHKDFTPNGAGTRVLPIPHRVIR